MVQLAVGLEIEFSEGRGWRCLCCGAQMGKSTEEEKWEELVEEMKRDQKQQASAIYHLHYGRVAVTL